MSLGEAGRLELGLGTQPAAVTSESNEPVPPPSTDLGISHAYVSIYDVSVHSEPEGWKTVRSDSFTVDLMLTRRDLMQQEINKLKK